MEATRSPAMLNRPRNGHNNRSLDLWRDWFAEQHPDDACLINEVFNLAKLGIPEAEKLEQLVDDKLFEIFRDLHDQYGRSELLGPEVIN